MLIRHAGCNCVDRPRRLIFSSQVILLHISRPYYSFTIYYYYVTTILLYTMINLDAITNTLHILAFRRLVRPKRTQCHTIRIENVSVCLTMARFI